MLNKYRLDPTLIFLPDHLSTDLASRSVRSGLITMISQGVQFVLTILGTMILARILTPSDFGLIGMVAAVIGFAAMFKNAGLSMATIQSKHITPAQVSALFWVNLLLSVGLGIGLMLSAPLVARFYQQPELERLTIVLSFSFIIMGLPIQHYALLYRHMNVTALALILIIAQMVSLAISIVMAFSGWGYWALAGSSLTSALVSTLLTFYFCPWIPSRYQKSAGIRRMLTFGGDLTVSNVSNYIASNMDNILIGRFLGADALGIYTKAYQLFLLPVKQIKDPLQNTALPALSTLVNQPDRYRRYYQRFLDMLASLTIPLSTYCFIEADFIVLFFLGDQWGEAVPVFRIFAILALIYPLAGTQTLVMVSLGESRRFLWWGITMAVFSVTSFIIGLSYNIEGVAAAFTIMNYIVLIPSLYFSFRNTPIPVRLFFKAIITPIIASLLAASGVLVFIYVIGNDSLLEHIIILAIFAGIYMALSYRRAPIREVLNIVFKDLYNYLGKNKHTEIGEQ